VNTESEKTTTVAVVVETIDAYMNTYRYSRDVNERWLASYLAAALQVCRQVRSGGLDVGAREQVNLFRRAEIAKEMAEKQRELDSLKRQAELLDRDIKQSAA